LRSHAPPIEAGQSDQSGKEKNSSIAKPSSAPDDSKGVWRSNSGRFEDSEQAQVDDHDSAEHHRYRKDMKRPFLLPR